MKSAVIGLFTLAAAVAVGVPAAGGDGASGDVCAQMTPQRLLQNPRFAKDWSDAMKSGDSAAAERLNEFVSRLRALHGCDGDATPDGAAHGHALPPGHPPVDDGTPASPGTTVFEEPSTLTI